VQRKGYFGNHCVATVHRRGIILRLSRRSHLAVGLSAYRVLGIQQQAERIGAVRDLIYG
jgi:hypothetical protein